MIKCQVKQANFLKQLSNKVRVKKRDWENTPNVNIRTSADLVTSNRNCCSVRLFLLQKRKPLPLRFAFDSSDHPGTPGRQPFHLTPWHYLHIHHHQHLLQHLHLLLCPQPSSSCPPKRSSRSVCCSGPACGSWWCGGPEPSESASSHRTRVHLVVVLRVKFWVDRFG